MVYGKVPPAEKLPPWKTTPLKLSLTQISPLRNFVFNLKKKPFTRFQKKMYNYFFILESAETYRGIFFQLFGWKMKI